MLLSVDVVLAPSIMIRASALQTYAVQVFVLTCQSTHASENKALALNVTTTDARLL